MKNDIEALQADVADHSVSVTALLQKAIALADKLGDDRFVAWARQELKGYTQGDEEVDYRRLKGKYVIIMPDNRRVPIQWASSVSGMDARFITLPLAEMESSMPSEAISSIITIQADSQFRASLRLQPGDRSGFEIVPATIAGFLQEIRNRVLDWTLGLTVGTEAAGSLLLTSSESDVASPVTVFYSWQSDLPNATNRGFIGDCLERAIKELRADPKLKVDPCLDRDTQNVPGSPDIASTIFDKIDRCGLFVCDVSVVNSSSSERPTPNPNVLIELGYAVKRLGWNRIVCVFNSAFGKVEKLPFDLRQRRVRCYNLQQGSDKAEQRKLLTGLLKADLRSILNASVPQENRGAESVLNVTFRAIAVHLCEIVGSLCIHYHRGLNYELFSPFHKGHANPLDLEILDSFPSVLDELRALPSAITRDKSTSDIAIDFYESVKWDLDQIQSVLTPRILNSTATQSLLASLIAFDEAHRELRHSIIGHKIAVTHAVFPRVIELVEKAGDLYRELLRQSTCPESLSMLDNQETKHGEEKKEETRDT